MREASIGEDELGGAKIAQIEGFTRPGWWAGKRNAKLWKRPVSVEMRWEVGIVWRGHGREKERTQESGWIYC